MAFAVKQLSSQKTWCARKTETVYLVRLKQNTTELAATSLHSEL